MGLYRYIPELILLLVSLTLHATAFGRVATRRARFVCVLSALVVTVCISFNVHRLAALLPAGVWLEWTRGIGYLWAITATMALAVWLGIDSLRPRFSPRRREFLSHTGVAALAAPAILTGYGVMSGRTQFHVKEVNLKMKNLPKDLDGFRILQLSDIHMSAFLTEEQLVRVIDMANETNPHLAVFTGDFITGLHDPLAGCINQLGRLKADHGVVACNGNHEIFAGCEEKAKVLSARQGIRLLRQEALEIKSGAAHINLVGVDYQNFRNPYLTTTQPLVQPGAFNLLLSHNPDVFPTAAAQGFQLTLAGHTHGGQVTVEILHQYANVARFFTPYVYGHYNRGNSDLYVTRGIGTVGIPARLGAPPEISLIRLCAS